jgi:acyl-CoA thioester hydrolase
MKSVPPFAFSREFTVTDAVVDANGHVNNVAYVQWMQDLAVSHYASVIPTEVDEAAGNTWVARRHEVRYRAPAFLGQTIQAFTWLLDFHRLHSRRAYLFLEKESRRELVNGETDWVYVQRSSGRPQRITEQIQAAFPIAQASGSECSP